MPLSCAQYILRMLTQLTKGGVLSPISFFMAFTVCLGANNDPSRCFLLGWPQTHTQMPSLYLASRLRKSNSLYCLVASVFMGFRISRRSRVYFLVLLSAAAIVSYFWQDFPAGALLPGTWLRGKAKMSSNYCKDCSYACCASQARPLTACLGGHVTHVPSTHVRTHITARGVGITCAPVCGPKTMLAALATSSARILTGDSFWHIRSRIAPARRCFMTVARAGVHTAATSTVGAGVGGGGADMGEGKPLNETFGSLPTTIFEVGPPPIAKGYSETAQPKLPYICCDQRVPHACHVCSTLICGSECRSG